jgi:hypothetical protein
MKTNGNDKSLESYKIFPFVAWGLVLSLALFVYNLSTDLKEKVDNLEAYTHATETKAHTPPEDIEDFEN